tara:strand:- start:13254 stop:15119 length:1866 start_codon:yes stop_codon:yes gene_type:complete
MAGKRLSIALTLNDKQFQSGLRKATRSMTKFGKSMQRTGQSFSRNLTAPIGLAGLASIKMASDFEESLNKTRVAFGESSVEVEAFAKTTLKSFGIAEGSALEMSSLFGDMATAMGLSQSEAAGMAQSLVGLAGDLASFKNIGIEQAQTALSGIFTGETESLKKLGIVLTEANLKQFGYNKTMTQSEKIAVRYRAVIEQTKSAQGDFARTSDGVANSSRGLGESIKQLSQDFGTLLLPLASKLISIFQDLTNKISSLDAEQKQFILRIAGITAVVGPLLIILGKLVTSITAVGKALIFLAANPMVIFASAVAGLVALLGFAVLDMEGFIKTALNLGKIGRLTAKAVIMFADATGLMSKPEALAAIATIDGMSKEQEKLADSMEDSTAKIEEQKKSIDKLISSMGKMPTGPSGNGMQSTGIFNFEPIDAAPISPNEGQTSPALQFATDPEFFDGIERSIVAFENINILAEQMKDNFRSFGGAIEQAFASALLSSGNFFENFIDFAKRALVQIMAQIAAMAFLNALLGSSPLGSLLGFKPIGGFGNIGNLLKQGVSSNAEGGLIQQPHFGLIGEAGPEVVMPLDRFMNTMGVGGAVEVFGKISGSDILLASDRARGNRNRTRGF